MRAKRREQFEWKHAMQINTRQEETHGAVRVLSDAAIWYLTLFVCLLVTCVICLSIANHPECTIGTKHFQFHQYYALGSEDIIFRMSI